MSVRARRFTPPIEEPVTDDLVLHAVAGRLDSLGGVVAVIVAWNGSLVHRGQVALDKPSERRRLADAVADAVEDVSSSQVDAAQVRLAQVLSLELQSAPESVESESDEESESEGGDRRPSNATRLVGYAIEAGVELFHEPGEDAEPYAVIRRDGCRTIYRVRSRAFRQWLSGLFYEREERAIGGPALQDALNVLDCRALFRGEERPVYVRLAEHDGAIYLDLGNDRWEAVEIAAAGWRVIEAPPVMFRRPRGLLPLPHPVAGGSVEVLRDLINVATEDDWRLVVAWLVAALRPRGPYPVLALYGEQGSAKTWTATCLRNLIDSHRVPLRSQPRDDRDLAINANNVWMVAYDNLSHLPDWVSDGLCRLATGGGYGTRELYSNDEERLFDAERPILVNGIVEIVTRPDLQDRAVSVTLPTIPDDKRRPMDELRAAFEVARPLILGALLDAVSAALRNLPTTRLERLPRMADFALWATAAELALGWEKGAFMDAYAGNRSSANEVVLEASPIVAPLRELLAAPGTGGTWEGTATQLLAALDSRVPEETRKRRGWPGAANALTGQLRRLAPNLRAAGLSLEFVRQPHTRTRCITIVPIVPIVPLVLVGAESGDDPALAGDDPTGSANQDRPPDRPPICACGDDGDGGDDPSADSSINRERFTV